MKTTIWAATITGAMLLAGAGTAQARIVYETFTSAIVVGYDYFGRFGAPNGDLSGKAIEVRYAIDLRAGGKFYRNGAMYDYIGGSLAHLPVVASVKVIIDGVIRSFATDKYTDFSNSGPLGQQDDIIASSGLNTSSGLNNSNYGDETRAAVVSYDTDFVSSNQFGTPIDYIGRGHIRVNDFAGFYASTVDDNPDYFGNAVHVVVTSTPPVPEPAALALFGLGASLLAVARRRR